MNIEITYNYHTHTERCGHATGKDEEYIKRAIECGVKYFGFSDHLPFVFPNGKEGGHRIPVSQAEEYVKSISALREKYKDKIDIKIGFEMEYYPEYFDSMLKNALDYGAEYLILGQHYMGNETEDFPHVFDDVDNLDKLSKYADRVIEAMETGVFTYVAHPDMCGFDVEGYEAEMKRICKASKELGIPLEINLQGVRKNRLYPNEAFWKLVGEEDCPVVIGQDSHDAQYAYDIESSERAKRIVNRYKLNFKNAIDIVDLQKKFN